MKRVVFMFPGQGSQDLGMGHAFYQHDDEAKTTVDNANDWLGFDIRGYMFDGPIETLTETKHAQPALVLSSGLALAQLTKAGVHPVAVLGHSLGEYSALVASGSLSLEQAVKLVYQRGLLMEQADPMQQGGMSAVLGLDEVTLEQVLAETEGKVEVANLNSPGQIVISGDKAAIEAITPKIKMAGAKRVIPLPVSGPFHSSFMRPQAEKFQAVLSDVAICSPDIPLLHNVTAKEATQPEQIKSLLIEQLYSKVRFQESIEQLLGQEIDAFVEVGNKKVLSGLVKKIDRKARVFHVEDIDSLQAFLTWYKEESE
ncbi:malonyl CoA-acyl carrier protein transacylase [Halolactibacillus alkaliphilus]|uniref:Malonyl CoA-acyl carrier protein transacylase n=1 Tax=Halolactibacillus alkaliphilus TaxID=442899 RepID=A0A511WXR5_9BACI|nr:ACP S-malonyltransferase [Halolactibacillus alkaliphilus]GEN55747.1 malonyl CoA-acyl carrier protein transacylase [Halolactibacillus alkaliphilus]GGN65133.1 malonyl CoA-acyl carrier protein transacylase [Halolactibacillus alkaliphilus]SFO64262.1 [acyl-carrier-protein] S-malonyltransferase [Halolactibacillus alkaliphilus]